MSPSKKQSGSGRPEQPNEELAGEYALGILTGAEKEKAQLLYNSNGAFRAEVESWQTRLAPMLDEVEEVQAPKESWSNIEKRLFADSKIITAKDPGIWSSLKFWRGLSLVSTALAAVLIGIVNLYPAMLLHDGPKHNLVAALNLAENKPTFLVQIDAGLQVLNIRAANLTQTNSRVPELWLIPDDGIPRSLGVISINGNTALKIDPSLLSGFKSGATLAISIEPAGGAPDGKPTGPIVATGLLQSI